MGLRLVHNRRAGLVHLSTATAVRWWLVVAAMMGGVVAFGGALTATGIAAIGLAFGGATGNLLDRVRRGAVVDFVAVGWWPVFNLADACLVIGMAMALWATL